MSNMLVMTPSACYSRLSIPGNKYTNIQELKPKLGILRNRNGDGSVYAKGEAPLLLEGNSKRNPQRLEYYRWLAANLAEEGRLSDFANLIAGMRNITNFVQQLQMNVVCAGFGRQIENGELYFVLETLSSLHTSGCHSPTFVDHIATQLIGNECRKLIENGNVKECIRVLQILSDCLFPIEDFVEPIFIIQQCIKLKKVRMALRYVSLLPPPHVWFNFLIREFGKQRDLMSALLAFQRSQRIATDMYSYRDIIDACGVCGNPEQARIIFQELLNQKVTPNVFVYNSIMNVNAGNLDYVLQIYKHMLVTYNTLLRARHNYGNLAEVQQSLAIYEEMRRAGYAPDDNLLKGLLAEWAEGAIQHNNCINKDQLLKEKTLWKETENTRLSYVGLFQKIAAHARPDNTNNLIRVGGLTKIEARIAVLAVLRILKERHGISSKISNTQLGLVKWQ